MIQLGMPKSTFGGGCRGPWQPRAPLSYCAISFTSDVQQKSEHPVNDQGRFPDLFTSDHLLKNG